MSGPVTESNVPEDSNISTLSSNDMVHQSEEKIPHHPNQEDVESRIDASADEIRAILEVIAATGKFWHDWDILKNMLSLQLKEVLAEYPEAQIFSSIELQQKSLSGETYLELVNRLDEALLSFIEGPPFTLQRLCEILLDPKSTYLSLSKLALALEKNLLVTSTLSKSADPYPTPPAEKPAEPKEAPHPNEGAPNGVGNATNDVDEEMVDAETEEEAASKDDTEMKEDGEEECSTNLERNKEPAISLMEPSATSASQAP